MSIHSCCNRVPPDFAETLAFQRMIVFDWYDGPTSGILVCDNCETAYLFLMLDWDNQHEIRLFSLAPLPEGSLDEVIGFFQEAPSWPVWFPNKLKTPTDDLRSQMTVLDRVIESAGPPAVLVAWSRSTQTALTAKRLRPELVPEVKDWFSVEDHATVRDWFAYVDLGRGTGENTEIAQQPGRA